MLRSVSLLLCCAILLLVGGGCSCSNAPESPPEAGPLLETSQLELQAGGPSGSPATVAPAPVPAGAANPLPGNMPPPSISPQRTK